MTVKHGAAITGIHFVIDDDAAGNGTNSSLTVDGANGTVSGAAGISDNIFEITADSTKKQISSITIANGAERTQINGNEFKLSSRVSGRTWSAIKITGSTVRPADKIAVTDNTATITGALDTFPSAYFLLAEGGLADGYGVTNLSVTKNKIDGTTTGGGGQALSIQGVNSLLLTDNAMTNLFSAVMVGSIDTQSRKNDNIITGNNDMTGTIVDCYLPAQLPNLGDYLGDKGILREKDEKVSANTTFLTAGIEGRISHFTELGQTQPTEHKGTQLFHSVTNAVASADENEQETVVLYGNATDNATIPANKQITLQFKGKTATGSAASGAATLTVASGGTLILGESAAETGGVAKGAGVAVEVQDGGTLTIKGGYYTGAIKSDYTDNQKLSIEGGHFSVEPNAAWVADGKGFIKNGNWWELGDAKLVQASGVADDKLGVDVTAEDVKNAAAKDDDSLRKLILKKAAEVNVNGYTVVPTDDTKQNLDNLVKAVKDQGINATFTVTYKATKDSSGTAIKDGNGADATVTVTYNLTSPILKELEQKIEDANNSLTNNPNKTDVAKQELKDAIDKANEVLKNPVDQNTVEQAKKDLEDAINKFIGSPDKPTPGGGGGGGSVAPAPKTYTVTFDDGVSHTTDLTEKVTSGQKVAKPADPTLKGYVFKGWFTDAALKDAYDFSKPVTGDLTLHAKWALATTDPLTFTDVDPKAWYVPGVDFVTSHGLMLGYGDTGLFGVGRTLTRGELAVILARFAAPGYGPEDFRDAKNETGFSDVADGQFYTWAANWAVKNGVINGYADAEGNRTGFGPNDPVTMEQLVAIIANLADKEGPGKADASVLAKFRDPLSVSPWATQSVAWAVEKGLINGSGENGGLYLHGSADIMRERVAVILMNAFHNGILSFE